MSPPRYPFEKEIRPGSGWPSEGDTHWTDWAALLECRLWLNVDKSTAPALHEALVRIAERKWDGLGPIDLEGSPDVRKWLLSLPDATVNNCTNIRPGSTPQVELMKRMILREAANRGMLTIPGFDGGGKGHSMLDEIAISGDSNPATGAAGGSFTSTEGQPVEPRSPNEFPFFKLPLEIRDMVYVYLWGDTTYPRISHRGRWFEVAMEKCNYKTKSTDPLRHKKRACVLPKRKPVFQAWCAQSCVTEAVQGRTPTQNGNESTLSWLLASKAMRVEASVVFYRMAWLRECAHDPLEPRISPSTVDTFLNLDPLMVRNLNIAFNIKEYEYDTEDGKRHGLTIRHTEPELFWWLVKERTEPVHLIQLRVMLYFGTDFLRHVIKSSAPETTDLFDLEKFRVLGRIQRVQINLVFEHEHDNVINDPLYYPLGAAYLLGPENIQPSPAFENVQKEVLRVGKILTRGEVAGESQGPSNVVEFCDNPKYHWPGFQIRVEYNFR